MNSKIALRLCASVMIAAGGALVSAQIQLPTAPPKQFGASINPAFEGWFDNPDGTHSFLIGYYSRNTEEEVDIPIGPNNHFEPGPADMGQPTHFLTRRRYGLFVVTVPKEFSKTQSISWTLNTGGVSTTIPFHLHVDYNLTPLSSSEEDDGGKYNTPAHLRFEEKGPSFFGPAITVAKAIPRTATVGTPMPLTMFVDDDALLAGGNPPKNPRPVVTAVISKYRGPGTVTVEPAVKFETLKGGLARQEYSGKATTGLKFSEAGEYMVHVMINDSSGNGGGGSGCCWTNAILKVDVK